MPVMIGMISENTKNTVNPELGLINCIKGQIMITINGTSYYWTDPATMNICTSLLYLMNTMISRAM